MFGRKYYLNDKEVTKKVYTSYMKMEASKKLLEKMTREKKALARQLETWLDNFFKTPSNASTTEYLQMYKELGYSKDELLLIREALEWSEIK
jgi:hypothetical protein